MLGRVWLSLAWFFAVVGALLGAGLSWIWIQDTNTSVFKNEFDALIIDTGGEKPNYFCWTASWESVYVRARDEQPPSYATKLLDPGNCVKRLKLENEKLAAKIPWLWAAGIAALTLWPTLVYGVYRWGLWLVRGKPKTEQTALKEVARPSS